MLSSPSLQKYWQLGCAFAIHTTTATSCHMLLPVGWIWIYPSCHRTHRNARKTSTISRVTATHRFVPAFSFSSRTKPAHGNLSYTHKRRLHPHGTQHTPQPYFCAVVQSNKEPRACVVFSTVYQYIRWMYSRVSGMPGTYSGMANIISRFGTRVPESTQHPKY